MHKWEEISFSRTVEFTIKIAANKTPLIFNFVRYCGSMNIHKLELNSNSLKIGKIAWINAVRANLQIQILWKQL